MVAVGGGTAPSSIAPPKSSLRCHGSNVRSIPDFLLTRNQPAMNRVPTPYGANTPPPAPICVPSNPPGQNPTLSIFPAASPSASNPTADSTDASRNRNDPFPSIGSPNRSGNRPAPSDFFR